MWKIRRMLSKCIIIFSIILLLFNGSAYAVKSETDENGKVTNHVTVEEVGDAVSLFAQNFVAKYDKQTKYGTGNSYNGDKVNGKYEFTKQSFIEFVYHNATGLDVQNQIKLASSAGGNISCGTSFEFILGSGNKTSEKLKKEEVRGVAQSGDILFATGGMDVAIYVDGDIVLCRNPDNDKKSPLKQMGLYPEDDEVNKNEEEEESQTNNTSTDNTNTNNANTNNNTPTATAENNQQTNAQENTQENTQYAGGRAKVLEEQENTNNNEEDNSGYEEEERTTFLDYCAIARIKESTADTIQNAGNVTTLFKVNDKEQKKLNEYHGTTEGSYVGATNVSYLAWLFDKILGFFDYLFGMIFLVIRAPFLGWANLIENMINDTINNVSGVSTTDTPEEVKIQSSDQKAISSTSPSAMEIFLSKRINIEDLIYNNVPFFDVDAFDVTLEKYQNDQIKIEKNSIMYKLREGIATWYFGFRNVAIVALLLILVYMGIRLAITSSSEKKADYKKMLVAWGTSVIIVFFIHYFMIFVLEGNNLLVNWCKDVNLKNSGGLSLYDTIRTRAYSLKLSEGLPATILYLVLIYYLIKYLAVYIRRYITVNVLTILAPVMAIKYALDYANTGRSGALSAWMYDYSLNVLLQALHSIIYTVLIIVAFELSKESIAGFIFCLVVLNFVFKAEEIFMKIFKFNDAKSLKSVTEEKNYLKTGLGLYYGAKYYTKGVLHYGGELVKGTAGFVGAGALALSQVGADLASKKSGKDIDVVDELNSIKNNITNKLDDKFYDITGDRSLYLRLNKLKETDPDLYENVKNMLETNSKLKKQAMKRSLKNGVAPVANMAKILTGIPMVIIDPKSAIPVMATNFSNLKNETMYNKKHAGYGHRSKKNISGVRKHTLANFSTFGIFGIMDNNVNASNKDLEKIRKNKKKIIGFAEADTIEGEILDISKNTDSMVNKDNKDVYQELKAKMIKRALDSVANGRDIKSAVNRYMLKNHIGKVTEADIPGILVEFNLHNIDVDIGSLKNISEEKIDTLETELAEIKETIKINSEIIEENNKNIAVDKENKEKLEKEIKMAEEQLKKEQKKLAEKEQKINERKQELEVIKKVEEKLKSDTENGEVMYCKIKETIKEYKKENREGNKDKVLAEEDVDKIVEKIKENNYTSKEKIQNKFAETKLDKKQSVNAILDAIEEDSIQKVESMQQKIVAKEEAKYGNVKATYTGLNELSKQMISLKAKGEKIKNTDGKRVIDLKSFTKSVMGEDNTK